MLWLDIHQKEKTGRLAKTISFFLREGNENSCKVEVTGKRVNLNNGEGFQMPCKLHFTGDAKYIDNLKDNLPALTYLFILFSPIF